MRSGKITNSKFDNLLIKEGLQYWSKKIHIEIKTREWNSILHLLFTMSNHIKNTT